MSAKFLDLPFKVTTRDGRNVVLVTSAFYEAGDGTVYCLPAGATSDGASTPKEVWPLLPPFGLYWPAAVLHDCAYRNTLLRQEGVWKRANLTKEQCDNLLLEAMASLNVDEVTRQTIYEGVAIGGHNSFEQDRAALPKSFMA
jgi:hypothetical protein